MAPSRSSSPASCCRSSATCCSAVQPRVRRRGSVGMTEAVAEAVRLGLRLEDPRSSPAGRSPRRLHPICTNVPSASSNRVIVAFKKQVECRRDLVDAWSHPQPSPDQADARRRQCPGRIADGGPEARCPPPCPRPQRRHQDLSQRSRRAQGRRPRSPGGDFVFLVGLGRRQVHAGELLIRDELATQGTVILDGDDRPAPGGGAPRRREIGIVFQDFKLLPTKTDRENIVRPRGDGHAATQDPGRRSSGCSRLWASSTTPSSTQAALGRRAGRTAIARALVHDPRTHRRRAHLRTRPLISLEILRLLLRINELGVTVLMATHDSDLVTALRASPARGGTLSATRSAAATTRWLRMFAFMAFSVKRRGRASGATPR